jgi:hypothetical protein
VEETGVPDVLVEETGVPGELVEETGVPGENNQSTITLSHNIVLSTPYHMQEYNSQL